MHTPSGLQLIVNSGTAEELSRMVRSLAKQFGVDLSKAEAQVIVEAEPEVKEEVKEEKTKKTTTKKQATEKATEKEETPTEEAKTSLTKEMVSSAAQALSAAKNLDAVKKIIAQFKKTDGEACRKISEIQEADYAEFIAACEKAGK